LRAIKADDAILLLLCQVVSDWNFLPGLLLPMLARYNMESCRRLGKHHARDSKKSHAASAVLPRVVSDAEIAR